MNFSEANRGLESAQQLKPAQPGSSDACLIQLAIIFSSSWSPSWMWKYRVPLFLDSTGGTGRKSVPLK
jgi:hypothetical protein